MGFKKPLLVVCFAVLIYLLKQYMNGPVCSSTARLDGKIVIITGPSGGIGKETAKDLAARGAKIYMGCRSEPRCESARSEIINETSVSPDNLIMLKLDLASLKSVRQFVKDFKTRENHVNILINNAGVSFFFERTLTEDGFEMIVGVNHLGHFLLTNLLMNELLAGKPSRVVTVASKGAENSKHPLRLDDLMLQEEYGPIASYRYSKLANVMFSKELGKRLQGKGVTTYSLHPGVIATDIVRYGLPFGGAVGWGPKLVNALFWPVLKTPYHGAQTTVCCAVDADMGQETGKYYSDCAVKKDPVYSVSEEDNRRLWELSVQLVKLTQEEIHPLLV